MFGFNTNKKSVEAAGGLETVELKIDGMHCASCALVIDDALEELEGVQQSQTEYARGKVRVEYDPARVQLEEIKKTISDQGYTVV